MNTRKNISRSAILFLVPFMFVIMAMILPETVYADDKEYNVDSAEFEVKYEENGDAVITEKWTVTYLKGSFTRFYKDIYVPDNQLEYFGDIQPVSCTVNGREATETDHMDRVDYHYFFENDPSARKYTVHWFLGASNQSVDYEIKYRIPELVKMDKNNRAVFCYRFIGKEFPKTVKNVKVKIEIPLMDGNTDVEVSEGEHRFEGNILYGEAQDVSGMLKYRVSMDKNGFSNLKRVVDIQVPAKKKPIEDIIGFTIFIVCFSFPFIAILAFGIKTSRDKKYTKKLLAENPDCFKDAADRLRQTGIPLIWYRMMPTPHKVNRNNTAENKFILLYLGIFDLCNSNRAVIKEDGIYIDKYYNGIRDEKGAQIDEKFIETIKDFFGISFQNDTLVLKFSEIENTLSVPVACDNIISKLNTWLTEANKIMTKSSFYKDIQSSGQMEQIIKDIALWKKYAKYANLSADIYECINIVKRNKCIDHYMILELLNTYKKINKFEDRSDDSFYAFCYFMDYETRTSTSNGGSSGGGCSSCSSCSSCGGCGGGGAD